MSLVRESKKITILNIAEKKRNGEKITMLTAYDALMADILDQTGIDIILVGDSGGMVLGGHDSTLQVTMDEMLFYTRAVRRGVKRSLLIADMPFMSFQLSVDETVRNAGRFLQEAGAEGVKLEGGSQTLPAVRRLVEIGIPVMGHLGLTPQSMHQLGGYQLQGTEESQQRRILDEAIALQEAGAFCLVLEKIPSALARTITDKLSIPTIGIGAGVHCDGQVLVSHDLLGLYDKFKPKFVRKYATLRQTMTHAFKAYIQDVQKGKFPNEDESY